MHGLSIVYIYRLAYAVKIIETILLKVENEQPVYLLYDIACRLVLHLKVSEC